MSEYDTFSTYYDTLMGDRDECVTNVQKLLKRYAPRATSVLELGCGTGSVLMQLSQSYEVAGVDLSAEMLKVARRKLPKVWLKQQNIAQLKVDRKFDVVLCLFDTINHLLSFQDWKEVFRRAHAALNPGGVFIFDINTVDGLNRYVERGAFAEVSRSGIAVFEASSLGRNKFQIELRLLKKQPNGMYKMHQTSIPELTIPTERIRHAAQKIFRRVSLWDVERKRPSAKSEELYFICQV